MKALVKSEATSGLWMEDVEKPTAGADDVLIRILQTSICGTDLHIYDWDDWAQRHLRVPLVLGHEFMGEIVEVGGHVEGLRVGERVSGEGHITCGHCRNCRAGRREFCHNHESIGVSRAGAFAEYLVIPAENVFPIPDHIGDDVATVLDPLGNATHTALAFDLVGEDVLITGAGPIGIMTAAIARHVGARFVVITDINGFRLDLAKAVGIDRVLDVTEENPEAVMGELGMVEGFDVGLETSGSESAFNQMLEVMDHHGRVAILGIPPGDVKLALDEVIFKGLTLKGIYGRRIFETWYKMAAMLQSGLDVSSVITHRLPADDYGTAFSLVRSGECGKVLLQW